MNMLRSGLVAASLVLALGGLVAPVAAASDSVQVASASATVAPTRIWHATRQCQIVRISDNHVVGYERADGTGNSQEAAVKAADRNIQVPQGHYKRHCQTKRIY